MTDQRPLTETELVLATLTNEELADAARFMGHMLDRWRESRAATERDRRDALLEVGYHGTEGPIHAIRALDLAIVRETAVRGGAAPWHAHQSTDGHPARVVLDIYRERLELNKDLRQAPRVSAAGALEQTCPTCGETKPLTVAFWEWLGSSMALQCRTCRKVDWPATGARFVELVDASAVADADRSADRAAIADSQATDDLGAWAP